MESDKALQVRMRHLLKERFQALDIARPLLFFEEMPVIGTYVNGYGVLLENGQPSAYFNLNSSDRIPQEFTHAICLDQQVSLLDALHHLAENDVVFLKTLDQVNAYITADDVQKAPVRMWLFGLLTIVEMFLTELIKENFKDERWRQNISSSRYDKTVQTLEERRRRGQQPDFVNCLQLSDKIEIVAKDEKVRTEYDLGSKTQLRKNGKLLEQLRNSLAHSQPIEDWQVVLIFVKRIDKILTRI